MKTLADRVAVITGAGRGMGREYALLFAREGAQVVVNDWGRGVQGEGPVEPVAQQVVDEIVAAGGQAIADTEDVATWDGAHRLIDHAIEAYGRVDVLVNNAVSNSHNSMIIDMPEEDFDRVTSSSIKHCFATLQAAARHWKQRSENGEDPKASVINVSSASGLIGNVAQGCYGANKAAIAALTIIGSMELSRYGIRVNGIAPEARTRLATEYFLQHPDFDLLRNTFADVFPPGPMADQIRVCEDPQELADVAMSEDGSNPTRVAPVVAYLAQASCPLNGEHIEIGGTKPIYRYKGWTRAESFETPDGWWTIEAVKEALDTLATPNTPATA
jgi:NAD(P)-dependent dehydrogenase (short-subunit alcohol dehydrogenase family)